MTWRSTLPERDADRVAESTGCRRLPSHRRPDRAQPAGVRYHPELQAQSHGYVELLGSGLFLPLTQEYASKEVRVGDVISRIGQIPRFLDQAKIAARRCRSHLHLDRHRRERGQPQPRRHGRRRYSRRLAVEGAVRQSRTRRQAGAQRLQRLDEERSRQEAHQRPHVALGERDGTRQSFTW